MGFLSAIKGVFSLESPPLVIKDIHFDSEWEETWKSILTELISSGGGSGRFSVNVVFDDEILAEIDNAIENHEGSERVPYSDTKAPINNVGESFRQEEIKEFCDGKGGDEMPWLSGFLLPEMANEYDKNAVAVYVIKNKNAAKLNDRIVSAPVLSVDKDLNVDDSPFELLHAGYMDKDSAKKYHKKILSLLGKNQFVPLLIRISGGTVEKPNYGVFPYAMTDKIKFI